jgi:Fe-S-cluster containining protein
MKNMAEFVGKTPPMILADNKNISTVQVQRTAIEYLIYVTKDRLCPFFDTEKKKCLVYQVRPKQCATYPAWPQVLQSEKTWEFHGIMCPGINKGDPLPIIESMMTLDGLDPQESELIIGFVDCSKNFKPDDKGVCWSKTCIFHKHRGKEIDTNGCKMYVNVKKLEEGK